MYGDMGGMDGMTDGDMMPEGGMTDGEMMPEGGMTDGEMMPEEGVTDGEMLPADGGSIVSDSDMAVAQRYTGGTFAKSLMAVAMPAGGMDGGSDMMGDTGSSDNAIVWVQSDEPPVNAILEPDPSWEQPEGFWAVPVTIGLSDNSQVEIVRGLSQGQVIFLGYQNPDQMY